MKFTISCVVDRDPRFRVELVLWAVCARMYLPADRYDLRVFFVGGLSEDMVAWLASLQVESHAASPLLAGSPHCNKIIALLHETAADYNVVTDSDLFFVDDPTTFFRSSRIRAAANNHGNPPPRILKRVLAASGLDRPFRPSLAGFRGENGIRETHVNNISAGIVAVPKSRVSALSASWIAWASWLIEHRDLLDRWGVHVDQVAFMLAMEAMEEDVEILPSQVNAILHIIAEITTPYAFHISSGHVPLYSDRFLPDRTLTLDHLDEGTQKAVARLNVAILEAVDVIKALPSTREHLDKFLNPFWRR